MKEKEVRTIFLVLLGLFILSTLTWIPIIIGGGTIRSALLWMVISFATGWVLIIGIFNIPNNPPHIGLLTKLDKKIWKSDKKVVVLPEGLVWVFLPEIFYNVILILKERRQKTLSPQKILTPDNVDIKVPITLAWNVNDQECDQFIDIGSDRGVDEHISGIIEGRLREYSRHPKEGPMDWKEMIASSLKTLDFLVKSLCENNTEEPTSEQKSDFNFMEKIYEGNVPTAPMLDFVEGKEPSNTLVKEKWGGEEGEHKWKKLLDIIPELNDKNSEIRRKIKKRKDLLEALQKGKANIPIAGTGCFLQRLTIGDIDPSGEIYEADIALQKEERQRESETFEVDTDIRKAQLLQEKLKKSGKEVSIEECFQIIMKWKMIKDGRGFVYDGSFGNFSKLGDIVKDIMKGGKE
ncbi:MAG: SPFH domain-containing protein [Candidatus Pacebacteria bacterium]|nr:SPFH domain-containing protein [Candidatus Paceibacterota bacterium]